MSTANLVKCMHFHADTHLKTRDRRLYCTVQLSRSSHSINRRFLNLNYRFQQGGAVTDDNLYGLSLTTVDRYTCRSKYEDREVTNTMLCFGLPREGGRDFFTRDVGAPVFYQNALISLISFGESDANNEYPLVGTGISDYTNWIIENAAS